MSSCLECGRAVLAESRRCRRCNMARVSFLRYRERYRSQCCDAQLCWPKTSRLFCGVCCRDVVFSFAS